MSANGPGGIDAGWKENLRTESDRAIGDGGAGNTGQIAGTRLGLEK
jgi:hypothetical protein